MLVLFFMTYREYMEPQPHFVIGMQVARIQNTPIVAAMIQKSVRTDSVARPTLRGFSHCPS